MLRKIILTETEKKQISNLYHLINEEEGNATLQGYTQFENKNIPDSTIKLSQNKKVITGANSDENGFFKIENLPVGTYDYMLLNQFEGYESKTGTLELNEPKVYDIKLEFDTQKVKPAVIVTQSVNPKTFLDVSVVDSDGNPLGPCNIEVLDSNNSPLIISKNITDDDGVLKFIEISDTNPGFEISIDQKKCDKKIPVSIKTTYKNLVSSTPHVLCVFNGRIKNEDGVETPTRFFIKNANDEVVIDARDTNIVKITLDTQINYEINVKDEETKEDLKTAIVKVFSDREKTKLIKEGNSPLIGAIKKESLKDGQFKNDYQIYYEISNEGYVTKRGKTVITDLNNKIDVDLKKIVVVPPTPAPTQKQLSEKECIKLTKLHYSNMNRVDSGRTTIKELGGVEKIKESSNDVKNCYIKYRKKYSSDINILTNRLINVQKDLDIFAISLTKDEIKDIYGESRTMSLKNTIRKVVSESVENKTERTLIEERLKFSLSGINKRNSSEVKRALRNERYNLINFGYNKELVRESFLDVMKGLYGNDGTNVLSDIKTRLGQRIADQVKNKQEEHEMILSAFNELSEEMIERAIKENRVDELSTEIATKALEIYKTQFGTEGLSGIMIASVDENKFKQEVAKLIEPAIKEITTKMDEKLKQVQDAVSGGLNPTA